jgi:Acetyltransferase (GNAT) domain
MTVTGDSLVRTRVPAGRSHRDLRWDGQAVRVSTPVPTSVWEQVAAADPTTLPFQTPAWRDCICAGSAWQDASRLYETAGGRQLVLMMARRAPAPGLTVEASWPAGWGAGGVLAPGGVRAEEAAMICADLASGRAASTAVRPGFATAAAWPGPESGAFMIPRAVHVATFSGESFEDYWARSAPVKTQRGLRQARGHIERAGVVITSGNSPELLSGLYQSYLEWIDWRAGQRKMPARVARWQARRAEPFGKFAAVAARLGPRCRIWVAQWEGRVVGATISLYAGDIAIGWRAFTSRSIPGRFRLFEVMAVEALQDAYQSGCHYFEMGESVGRKDLSAIKERLGGREHTFSEYCFERVPLIRGRMAYQRLRRQAEEWVIPRVHAAQHRRRPPERPERPGGAA